MRASPTRTPSLSCAADRRGNAPRARRRPRPRAGSTTSSGSSCASAIAGWIWIGSRSASARRRRPLRARGGRWRSSRSSFSGNAARITRHDGARAGDHAAQPRGGRAHAEHDRHLARADLGDQQQRHDQHRGRGQRGADAADEAGGDPAQPLAEQAARTVRREAAVRERQVQQDRDRRRAAAACRPPRARRRPAAAPRKQRTAATSIPATIRYAPDPPARRAPTAIASPPGPIMRFAADVHRHQRQAGEQPAGQQQDAADLAAAVVASVPSGRLGWWRLGGHAWSSVLRWDYTYIRLPRPTPVKFPARLRPLAIRRRGVSQGGNAASACHVRERVVDRLLLGVRLLGGGMLRRSVAARRRRASSGCLAQWAKTASAAARVMPGTAASSSTDASRTRLMLPKWRSSWRWRPGPMPGMSDERRAQRQPAALAAVEADREAVRLVAQRLQHEHLGAVGADRDRVLRVREEDAIGLLRASALRLASRRAAAASARRGVGAAAAGGVRAGGRGRRLAGGSAARGASRRRPPRAAAGARRPPPRRPRHRRAPWRAPTIGKPDAGAHVDADVARRRQRHRRAGPCRRR